MTDEERNRLALAHQHVRSSRGLLVTLAWAPAIPVEGAPPEGSVDYDGLHEDHRTLIDAVPGLSADSAKLAALEAALDVLRAALVEEVAKAERGAVSAANLSLDEALELGAADAYGEAIQRLDVARSGTSSPPAQATAVRAGRGGRLGGTAEAVLDVLRQTVLDGDNVLYDVYNIEDDGPGSKARLDMAVTAWRDAGMPAVGAPATPAKRCGKCGSRIEKPGPCPVCDDSPYGGGR